MRVIWSSHRIFPGDQMALDALRASMVKARSLSQRDLCRAFGDSLGVLINVEPLSRVRSWMEATRARYFTS